MPGAHGTSLALKIIKFPMEFFDFESKAGAMRSRKCVIVAQVRYYDALSLAANGDEEEVELGGGGGGCLVAEEAPEEGDLAPAVGLGVVGDGGEDVEGGVAVEVFVVHEAPEDAAAGVVVIIGLAELVLVVVEDEEEGVFLVEGVAFDGGVGFVEDVGLVGGGTPEEEENVVGGFFGVGVAGLIVQEVLVF